jgi:hypothetical protein
MIDASLIKHLADDEKSRLQILERFFEHDGWKLFTEYLEQQYSLAQDLVNNAPTWDAYLGARTKMKLCFDMSQLPEQTRQEFETMALENQSQDDESYENDEFDYE